MRTLVNQYGPRKWSAIASHLPGRVGKQCRERWQNHLRPDVNKVANLPTIFTRRKLLFPQCFRYFSRTRWKRCTVLKQ